MRQFRVRHPLLSYALRRAAIGALIILLTSFLVFVVTTVLPGDPAQRILGRYASPENVAALRHQLGLDRPFLHQYVAWLGDLVHGDFGHSITGAREPVSTLVWGRIQNSLTLAAVAFAVLIPLAIALGVWAGIRAGRAADQFVSGSTLALIALPDFVVGSSLILIFSVWMAWLPPISLVAPGQSPLVTPSVLVLPVATVVTVALGLAVRMVRAGVIETMSSEYVQTARLNGIPERRVVYKHALRNALGPTVQVLALTLQWLIGGLFIIETVFSYPGIGLGLVEAVINKDINYIQAVSMLLATAYIVINIVADVLVVLLVPKLRTNL
jgi:peptide/nickel transport system permease protein